MLVDWQDVRTGLVVTALIKVCEWGIGKVSQSKQKRRAQSNKQKNRAEVWLPELARIFATACIVVAALAYEQRFIPKPTPRYVELAQRAPNLAKAVVAAPYQSKHKGLPCKPKLTQPYIDKIATLSKQQREGEYWSAVRWAIGEGLLEELDIQRTDEGGKKIDFSITALGEQFIDELCRDGKL